MSDMSKDFTVGVVTKSTGITDKADIPFGKSMMNSLDRGFSPITKLQEVVVERIREQENTMQIVRDNFLKTR
ncbi:MAG: hypothetical protein IJ677_05945 [Alphaproteobacteria bacterium]|nr:hypothetical protein [Alphaproteobacteria bacterium]